MIKLQNYTPEVYYRESRDFQFIGRLFDLVLNSVKTEADLLYNIPLNENSDEKLLELLALTLGFKPKHHYNTKQLKAVCSVFSDILKNKGNITSIKIACEALFSAMDISQQLDYDYTAGSDKTELNLYISQDFGDITILNDLLSYTLPAGMSCNIIREFHINTESNTNVGIKSTVTTHRMDTKASSQLAMNKWTYAVEKDEANNDVVRTSDVLNALIRTNAGYSVNSEIIKLEEEDNG